MDDSLNTALKLMATADVRELPVVSEEDPRKAIRNDIARAYHDELERMKRSDIGSAYFASNTVSIAIVGI